MELLYYFGLAIFTAGVLAAVVICLRSIARKLHGRVRSSRQMIDVSDKSVNKAAGSAGAIAISYRRDDSLAIAGRLYDRLQAKFGKQNVFMDFDSIPPGVDFREQIKRTIERSNLVIAVIGPHWLGEQSDGSRRIDDPTDFVHLEIEYALKRGIPVIPLLVNNTPMPRPEKLPSNIEALAFRNALPLDSGIDFHNHADRLIKGISASIGSDEVESYTAADSKLKSNTPAGLNTKSNQHRTKAAWIIVLATAAVAAIWWFTRTDYRRPDEKSAKTVSNQKFESIQEGSSSLPSTASESAASPTETRKNPAKTAPVATSKTPASNYILVDLKKGIVDGVNLKVDGQTLQTQLGVDRVQKTTELLEGDASDVYIISFGKHKIYQRWSGFSFSDKIFKTSEGLGVGSSVADFERTYGKGKVTESEGDGALIHFGFSTPSQFAVVVDSAALSAGRGSYSRFSVKEVAVQCPQ